MLSRELKVKRAIVALRRIGQTFIRNPKRWTRNSAARNKDGKAISPRNPAAVQFCSVGALEARVRNGSINHIATEALRKVLPYRDEQGSPSIVDWNDRQSRATTVGNKFLKAAKYLETNGHPFDY